MVTWCSLVLECLIRPVDNDASLSLAYRQHATGQQRRRLLVGRLRGGVYRTMHCIDCMLFTCFLRQSTTLQVVTVAEFALTLSAHSLTLRYCMFHSFVLTLLALTHFYCRFIQPNARMRNTKGKQTEESNIRVYC